MGSEVVALELNCLTACGILVPRPGIDLHRLHCKEESNHSTTRDPQSDFLIDNKFLHFSGARNVQLPLPQVLHCFRKYFLNYFSNVPGVWYT